MPLNNNEKYIVQGMLKDGASIKQIAEDLDQPYKTVQYYAAKLKESWDKIEKNKKEQEGIRRNKKRAEMWGLMRDFLKAGAELPEDSELDEELQAVEYGFTPKLQIQLEKKEDMKKRLLASPDCGDALALSFAFHVNPKTTIKQLERDRKPWNPWAVLDEISAV